MGVTFTPSAADRISRAVRTVEKQFGAREFNAPYDSEDLSLMLEVFPTNSLKLGVRAGVAIRWSGGVQTEVSTSITGVGATFDPLYYEELTIAATGYVIGTLSDPDTPLTFILSYSAGGTFPTSADATVLPIAYVEVTAGIITKLVQIHKGPWLESLGDGVAVDDSSIELNSFGEIQIHKYNDGTPAAVHPVPDGSLLPYWDYSLGYVDWASPYSFVDSIPDWTGIDISGASGDWEDLTHGTIGTTSGDAAQQLGYETNTDHDLRYPILGDTFTDVFFDSIGFDDVTKTTASPVPRIGLELGQLLDGLAVPRMDWLECLGYAKDAGQSLDWDNRELTGDWSCSGDFTGDGFVQALSTIGHGFRLSDATNYWDADGLQVVVGASGFSLATDEGLTSVIGTDLGVLNLCYGTTLEFNNDAWEEISVQVDIAGVPTTKTILAKV